VDPNPIKDRSLRETIRALLDPLQDKIAQFERHTTAEEIDRISATTARIPKASSDNDQIVDVGGTLLWMPIYSRLLGYRKITVIQNPGYVAWMRQYHQGLCVEFNCEFIAANADKTTYSLVSEGAACVLCFELLEHLQGDPMHLVSEVNRILKPNGFLYLTTPNILYSYNLFRFLFGDHPFSWSVFTADYGDRHNREYTPSEVTQLLEAGGFSPVSLETLTYANKGSASKRIAAQALSLVPALMGRVPLGERGAFIHWRGHKVGPVRNRYPAFLYDLGLETSVGNSQGR
jgi:SAM-dependent methyltransferase